MLKEISLGHHHFRIGLMLRDTNIINPILFNSEVWYGVSTEQIETLEKIDVLYLRKLFNGHSKTAIEAFYIEAGKMPIRMLIKIRRLMYWWHLINSPKTSLIQRCYLAQKIKPVKKDWIEDVENDKKYFKLIALSKV